VKVYGYFFLRRIKFWNGVLGLERHSIILLYYWLCSFGFSSFLKISLGSELVWHSLYIGYWKSLSPFVDWVGWNTLIDGLK